jgi:hypothetical protein
MHHAAHGTDVEILRIQSIIVASISNRNERQEIPTHLFKHPRTLAPASPPPSRRARPVVACSCPARSPAASHRLLLSVPAFFSIGSYTRIPDPNPRHHNPVVEPSASRVVVAPTGGRASRGDAHARRPRPSFSPGPLVGQRRSSDAPGGTCGAVRRCCAFVECLPSRTAIY